MNQVQPQGTQKDSSSGKDTLTATIEQSRSHLLRPWLVYVDEGRGARIISRFVQVTVICLVLTIFWLALIGKWFDVAGPMKMFFLLYDHIYLVAKGWIFYWFHPWSWIWLGFALALLAYQLGSFIYMKPLSIPLHLLVANLMLQLPGARNLIRWSIPYFASLGLVPGMLAAVADYRRKCLLAQLYQQHHANSPTRHWKRLTGMSRLSMAWTAQVQGPVAGAATTLEQWRQSFFLIQSFAPAKKIKLRDKLLADLAGEAVAPLLHLMAWEHISEAPLKDLNGAAFSEETLACDLLALLAKYHPQTATDAGLSMDQAATLFRARLNAYLPERLRLLEAVRQNLTAAMEDFPYQVDLTLPASQRSFWGRTSLDLVLAFAHSTQRIGPAQAYLDTIQAIDFFSGMLPLPQDLTEFLSDHPLPDQCRYLAILEERITQELLQNAAQQSVVREKIIHTGDLDQVSRNAMNLYDAAGPYIRPENAGRG